MFAPAPSTAWTLHWFGVFDLVKSNTIGTAVPCSSYTVMEAVTRVPAAASEGRLPPSFTECDWLGGMTSPGGMVRSLIGLLRSILPDGSAIHPWTVAPSGLTNLPLSSNDMAPARVYICEPSALTTKKPSPWMAMSVERPVCCSAPWVNEVATVPIFTPMPTCDGFEPPKPVLGLPAPLMVWLSRSSKTAWLDLNPVVLTLAMLLPITSIIVWWDRRPETAENIERSIW